MKDETLPSTKLYNDYNTYLKNRYGEKVYRIGLDAGFTCPNRDGTRGRGGCIYCAGDGSRSSYTDPKNSVTEQLRSRIEYLKEKKGAAKFIAYFQAFTNTYAPVAVLKRAYDQVLPFKDVVGLSIGTRPDAVDKEKMELIASYKKWYDVWVEYGLQSVNDRTLAAIKRGHSFGDFLNALNLAKKAGVKVAVHVILGLPGETREDMINTARTLNKMRINGIKIHLLHVLKGSVLEKLHRRRKVRLLEQAEYADLVCDFLEHLSSDIIIQRLTGEGTRESHIAPAWALDKLGTLAKIRETMEKRGSCQGAKSASRPG
ncbi:MAG: TIGR01212 family radical SAM protein [Candidatus Omnitrophota bacterium]